MSSNIEDYMSEDLVDMMKSLFHKGRVMKDYKLVGNGEGTTIVLHLCDPKHVTPKFTMGKGPGRQVRDQARYEQYMSSGYQYSPWSVGQACTSEVGTQQPLDANVNNPNAGLSVKAKSFKPRFNLEESGEESDQVKSAAVDVSEEVMEEVLAEEYIHFDGDIVMDSRNGELKTMHISDEDDLIRVKTKGRNQHLLKVVQDRRQNRNHLIGETDDFVLIYDVINDKDMFLGKWQTDKRIVQVAQHLLVRWENVDPSHEENEENVEVLDELREVRLLNVHSGALKLLK